MSSDAKQGDRKCTSIHEGTSPSLETVISDDELVLGCLRSLNRQLNLQGFTPEEIALVKKRRRTLKNRAYAVSFRRRRVKVDTKNSHEPNEIRMTDKDNNPMSKDFEKQLSATTIQKVNEEEHEDDSRFNQTPDCRQADGVKPKLVISIDADEDEYIIPDRCPTANIKSKLDIQPESESEFQQIGPTIKVEEDVISEVEFPVEFPERGGDDLPPYSVEEDLAWASESFHCDICSSTFLDCDALKIHQKTGCAKRLQPRPEVADYFECDKCQERFARKFELNDHVLSHFVLKPFAFKTCDKEFEQHEDLVEHMKRVEAGHKRYKCKFCEMVFLNESALESHLPTHPGVKAYECEMCPKQFARRYNLERHIVVHSAMKMHSCGICGKTFRRKLSVKNHMLVHIGDNLFECDICGEKFASIQTLKAHMDLHTNSVLYKCEICLKEFGKKDEFNLHMSIHSGSRHNKCEICSKIFFWLRDLDRHVKATHTNVRPFKCKECEKEFTVKRVLDHHMLTHTVTKPHICPVCSKGFKRIDGLLVHTVMHSKPNTSQK